MSQGKMQAALMEKQTFKSKQTNKQNYVTLCNSNLMTSGLLLA